MQEEEAIQLPCCFALKSKRHESYLRYVHEEGDETTHGKLQLNGEDAVNPFTRFDSEPSLLHQGLVHIRCRYNRKYWVPRQRGGGWWIAADAHVPDEDLHSPNCTLIKPIISVVDADPDADAGADPDDATSGTGPLMSVRFLHGKNDTRMAFSTDRGTGACMRVLVGGDDDVGSDAFTVLNLAGSPRRLPKLVVFKGDNNMYLSAVTISGRSYLQFSARDPGDPTVVHEITQTTNGRNVYVRNVHLNMMWWFVRMTMHEADWVFPSRTPDQAMGFGNAMFTPVDVREYFGFRATSNHSFLHRFTRDGIRDCLGVLPRHRRTIEPHCRIRVEEAILDRQIYNVEYRLSEARIYDTSVLTMVTTAAVNDTSRDNTTTLTLAYDESELSTWDATLELKLGYHSKIRAGFPKLGLGATVSISAEFFGAYNWGETMEKKVSHEVEYEVTVPPNTKVTVSLMATRSAVDVPFNYWQKDLMYTGQVRDEPMEDGLYTGINSYHFKFHTTEEKLKPRLLAPTPS